MIGQTLSHYRIVAPIGKGAMGEVFRAEDVRLGRQVALKLLPAEVCCTPAGVERFEREARIVSSLNHPHICTLFDIGVHDGRNFMVMELLEGEALHQRLSRGPLAVDDLLTIGVDVAEALDAAHQRGVIHRDIKPANLFLTHASGIKVLDFGIAKLAGAAAPNDTTQSGGLDQLTMLGTAVGTVAYMSPEQARGEAIDARTDLFSLGVVLYEMATGRTPFTGATTAVVYEGILTKTPPAPSTLRTGLPEEFDAIVMRALQKSPAARYQSARELRDELKRLQRATDQVLASASTSVGMPTTPRFSRRWWWLAAPAAGATAVAAFIASQSAAVPALQGKDPVVLAALMNRTGDTMFDDTLGEALAVQLRQSPFLNLIPDQRVQATLRMMQRPANTVLDTDVGREVCQRVAAKALLTSAIASLGGNYLITLRALDCVTGDTLAERQAEATRKEDVIGTLGEAARGLREQLGESLASMSRYDAKVEMATTSSLEALKAYSQAMSARRTQGDQGALPLFRRAVELDPEFALAHARLGTSLSNVGDLDGARQHTEKAYQLRSRVSEPERLYIEARYHTTVSRDVTKAIEAYRVMQATYPNDYSSRVNLAMLLGARDQGDEAVRMLREAVDLAPEESTARINLAAMLLKLGRYDEARREAEQAIAQRDDASPHGTLLSIGVFTKDAQLEQRELEWLTKHDDRSAVLPMLWSRAVHRGEIAEAERMRAEVEQIVGSTLFSVTAQVRAATAVAAALLQQPERARALATQLERDRPVESSAGDRLAVAAMLNDAAMAARTLPVALAWVAKSSDSEREQAALRALAQMAAGDARRAIESLGPVRLVDSEASSVLLHAYLSFELKRYDDALRDFEWTRDRRRSELSLEPAIARFKIAQTLERAGRPADARKAYQDFLDYWKTADRDLPPIIEATKALARLSS